jgi:hypothetical protein
MYEFNWLLTRAFRQNGTGKQTDKETKRQRDKETDRQREESTSTKTRVF